MAGKGRGDIPCLNQEKADAWDEGYNAAVMQKYGIGPNPRNPYYDYTEVDGGNRADHAYVESGGGFCAKCDQMFGEGNHE
jgi:hypothetical protein